MPSFLSSTQSIQSYDRTLHMLNSSLMLVSISEDGEYDNNHHDDFPTMIRCHNTNLRRDSLGNQSCKTGLDELANAYTSSSSSSSSSSLLNMMNRDISSSPTRSTTSFNSSNNNNLQYQNQHCVLSHQSDVVMNGYGFYINE